MRGCLAFMLLLSAACDIPQMSTVLATVGQQDVTRQDVVYRIGIAKAYGHKQPMNEQALVYVIQDALTRQVAAQVGVEVTVQEMDALSAELDKQSNTHKIQNAVKWVFDESVANFRHAYLEPRVRNRKLQAWYAEHVSGQQRPQSDIDRETAQSSAGQGATAYDAWFRHQARSLHVQIRDARLRAGVQKQFPHMWWLKG